MRDNSVERNAPMLAEAGFTAVVENRVGAFLHCVGVEKPGGDR